MEGGEGGPGEGVGGRGLELRHQARHPSRPPGEFGATLQADEEEHCGRASSDAAS